MCWLVVLTSGFLSEVRKIFSSKCGCVSWLTEGFLSEVGKIFSSKCGCVSWLAADPVVRLSVWQYTLCQVQADLFKMFCLCLCTARCKLTYLTHSVLGHLTLCTRSFKNHRKKRKKKEVILWTMQTCIWVHVHVFGYMYDQIKQTEKDFFF